DGAECTARAEHSSPSQPTGRRSLSLPVRWRVLLLSPHAARARFVTQRQTFVRRGQTLLSLVALLGSARGCQPWGRSASSAVAAAPRRQTRCLLLLVEEALGGYAHVSQCEAPLPVALRLDLLLGGIAT